MESQDRYSLWRSFMKISMNPETWGNVDFQGYVSKLMNHLFLSYGVDQSRVRCKVEVAAGSIGIDSAVPCGSS